MNQRNYEREADMLRRYAQGETMQEIGDDFGLSRERVRQILKRLNVTADDMRERRYRMATALYKGGLTATEAAKRAGVHPALFRGRLVAAGQRRPRPPRVPKHGTVYEYQRGCRCEPCTRANADRTYEYQHRKHPEMKRYGRYGPRQQSA